MTTSRPGKNAPAEPPDGPRAVPGGAPPSDEQDLRQEIEQTREELARTVEQLAGKADVKGRVQARAARQAVIARQKAAAAADTARAQLRARTAQAREAAPELVRRNAATGGDMANQRRVSLMAAAAALIAGWLALRSWRKR